MNKILLIIIAAVALIVVGGGAFYGGMMYGQNSLRSSLQNFANLSPQQRQQLGGAFRRNNNGNNGFASGDIIANDDKSITVKLSNGSSKIVFFSGSTQISKSVSGSSSDLTTGKTVSVNGTANQDGSITAQSIQLRESQTSTGQ
jgi:hypothetical protein